MKRGFSLFEVLLVLLIGSMIIVGGIEYAKRKGETAAAEQLGHRLYLYGVAVSDYARQNPHKLTGSVDHYGVEWLKNEPNPENCKVPNDLTTCEMFLGQDFNLKFQSIVIESFTGAGSDDGEIYTKLNALPAPSASLEVELVQLGRVVHYAKGQTGYQVDASLSSRAINFANNYTDQFGTPPITYALSSLDNQGYIIGGPSTLAPGVDAAYLMTNGANTMKASIRFEPTVAQKNIEGVREVNFDTSTRTTNEINDLNTVNFSNNTIFTGMRRTVNFSVGTLNAIDSKFDYDAPIPGASPNDECFLSAFKFKDGDGSNDNSKGCAIYKKGNDWWLFATKINYCTVVCLAWQP